MRKAEAPTSKPDLDLRIKGRVALHSPEELARLLIQAEERLAERQRLLDGENRLLCEELARLRREHQREVRLLSNEIELLRRGGAA